MEWNECVDEIISLAKEKYWNKPFELFNKYPNLSNICCKCYELINQKIKS